MKKIFMFLAAVLIVVITGCGGGGSDPIPAPPSTLKAITALSLNGVVGTINETGKTIAVAMPFGTDVTALVATFTTTGANVKVGSTVQISGTTANNFTSPVIYTVTAADATTQDYTVFVTVALSSSKAITTFSLAGVVGTINETAKTIAVTMPFGTSVTALVATFTTTGASVKVGSTVQISGTTANNFTSPVTYTVTAADATTQDYTVTVTVVLSSAKAITAFSLNGVVGTINETGKTIAVAMPFRTSVTALVATFTTTGANVKVGSTIQISGTTAHNFTSPVIYTVTASDATTQDYMVFVTVALSSAKAITTFSLAGVVGTINETGKTIAVTMPFGTSVTALVTTFNTTGANVKVGSTVQISGTTANNFTSPVIYTVTAADATTQDYTVTVTVAASPSKAITAFSLAGVVGTINETGKTIAVAMPFGTDVTALVATFTTTGASVKVGSTVQSSGTTANNFTSPVIYTVTAADATTQDYTVTVTVAASPAKAVTAFSLNGVVGTINETGKTIAVTMPFGTSVTALVASFTTTGANVKVGSTLQISGTTANNFTTPVTYTVTAADATTQDYMVFVTVALSSSKAITAFSLAGIVGTINEAGKTILVAMPFTPSVSALVATFTTTGANVKVGSTLQISGTTANNFTTPVTYTVTAADATTQDYMVTVTAVTFVTTWGSSGTGNGQFSTPRSIAVDASGNVYVTDYGNNRIQKFSSSGAFITAWGSYGTGNGQFYDPRGISVDASGNVYVSDSRINRIQKFSSSGAFITTWGSSGSGDGQFSSPIGITVDASGNVYVTDYSNNRIQKFSSSGAFITAWGSYGTGNGQFWHPTDIVVDVSGNVYVMDQANYRIQKFSSSGAFITTWGSQGEGNGQFIEGYGVAVDASGNVYATDAYSIKKFSSSGAFITTWGSSGTGNGQFANPSGVAVDASGNVYVADTSNNRIQVFAQQ